MAEDKPGRFLRISNRMVDVMLRLGMPMGAKRSPMYLLTVAGRRSGQPRRTPVALTPTDGGWILASVYGRTDWAKNLEVARQATITRCRRTVQVTARRLDPTAAAPVLRDGILSAPDMVQKMTAAYFTADAASPIETWEEESERHPVFILSTAESAAV